jgi:hypothetical protein
MAKRPRATWQKVYRTVVTSRDVVVTVYEAQLSRGWWRLRAVGGDGYWKEEPFFFERHTGATPEEAIEKFIHRMRVKAHNLAIDLRDTEAQLAQGLALQQTYTCEVKH